MTNQLVRSCVAAGALLMLTAGVLVAQGPAASRSNATASGSAIPRTAEGKPDFQGFWENATYTPFERPEQFKDKEFFTAEEAQAYAKTRMDDFLDQDDSVPHYDDAIWMLEKNGKGLTSLRTSIVVDPPNGRIPPMNAEGQKRTQARAAARKGVDAFASAQTRSLSERCIYWAHEGPPVLPTGYNSNVELVQAPNHFVIIPEMMPDARVVPLTGQPHLTPTIRKLRGDSRGWWEGDTMVVETTNFTDRTAFRNSSQNLKVTERFTLLDADTLRYQFTIDDPSTWDVAWKGEYPMKRSHDRRYEYACHEGNYGIVNILRGQRAAEAAAAK